jgi:hypothetical protein
MSEKHHNLAPLNEDLTRAGNELYYAVISLLDATYVSPQVQDALAGWRRLMEAKREVD